MAAIAQVGSINANTNGTTALSLTTGYFIITTGYTVVVSVTLDNASLSVSDVYDSLGANSYTLAAYANGTGVREEIWIAYVQGYAPGINVTVTATLPGSTKCNIAIIAATYSNVTGYAGFLSPVVSYIGQTVSANSVVLPSCVSGNLIVVAVTYQFTGVWSSLTSTLSDTLSSGLTRACAFAETGTDELAVEIWYGWAGGSGSDTITSNMAAGSPHYPSLSAIQFAVTIAAGGLDTIPSGALGSQGAGAQTGTTATSTSTATTTASDIIVGACAVWAHGAVTPFQPWLQMQPSYYGGLAYEVSPTYTGYAVQFTVPSNPWAATTAAFKSNWTPVAPPYQFIGNNVGAGVTVGSLSGTMIRATCNNTDSASLIVSGMGWATVGGETGTTYSGTQIAYTFPSNAGAAAIMIDNSQSIPATLVSIFEMTSGNRQYACASIELRGSGGTVYVPTFPSFGAGGVLPPTPGGGGQIFPPSVRQQ